MNKNEYLGKTIVIITMKDEPTYSGRIGVVELVDDMNQLHGTWGSLAVIPGVDSFQILEDNKWKIY